MPVHAWQPGTGGDEMALDQAIIRAELDGPRPRSLRMQLMGEGAELLVHGVQNWDPVPILELPRNGGLG